MNKADIQQFKYKPMYRYLLLLAVAAAIAFQGWRTLFNNFSIDQIGLNSFNVGVIQSVREVPGFLGFLVIYLLLIFKEHRLSAYSVILMGAGVLATGFFPSYFGLAFTTLIMSVGYHYYETTNQSLTIQYFSKIQSPLVFARIRSLTAVSNIAVGALIFLSALFLDFKGQYVLIGLICIVIAIYALSLKPHDNNLPKQHRKFILKRRYWLFYILNFLSGSRRQIFVVFAIFLLVKKYHFSIKEITILFIINNIIAYFINPLIAKGINKFGERKVLSFEYSALIIIFLAYAFSANRWTVAGLYVLDHIFFNFSITIKTYFQKTADVKDISPSMGVASSINHIAAVVVPVIGGALWLIDWKIPFLAAAFLALCSLVLAQRVRT